MCAIKMKKRCGLLFASIVVFAVAIVAIYVYKTITYVEYPLLMADCFDCNLDAGVDKMVEYLIVDLENYKLKFAKDTAERYYGKIKEYSSKTQSIVFRKTPMGYWSIYEITQKQFENVMGYNPSFFKGKYYMTRPVEDISRNDATAFLSRLCNQTGLPFKLPSKAEWVSACLAGDEDISRENICKFGRISINTPRNAELNADHDLKYYCSFGILEKWLRNMSPSYAGTQFVGCYLPNAWGLYDMHGNVREWTSTKDIREGEGILMGGTCISLPEDCMATSESSNGIDNLYSQKLCGFRVFLSTVIEPEERLNSEKFEDNIQKRQ